MNIQTAVHQLLSICQGIISGEPFSIEEADLETLYSIAYRHGLDGFLYYSLFDAGLDADASSAFAQAHARLRHRIVTNERENLRLSRLLDSEQIPVMRLSDHQACCGEHPLRPQSAEYLFVAPENADRLSELLLANGFQRIENGQSSCRYLCPPYFFVETVCAPRERSQDTEIDYFAAWNRAMPSDGFRFVSEMSLTDSYVFLLSVLYRNLAKHGVSLADVLDVAHLRRCIVAQSDESTLRQVLAATSFVALEDVLLSLYRAWIENEKLSPSMQLLSDLMLARGAYADFNAYLCEGAKHKGVLSYALLPYSEMRVGHPFCRSVFLYPIALMLRLLALARRRTAKEPACPPLNDYALTPEQGRALWRSVGVSLP